MGCGAKDAQAEIAQREKSVVPLGNKQGYAPLGKGDKGFKAQLLGVTGKGIHS